MAGSSSHASVFIPVSYDGTAQDRKPLSHVMDAILSCGASQDKNVKCGAVSSGLKNICTGALTIAPSVMRPSATKSGLPYGVTPASSLSSCRTPPTLLDAPYLGWDPPPGPHIRHNIVTVIVSHDHVMEGRGRSAITLMKRTC